MVTKTTELRGLLAAFGASHQNNFNLLLHVLTFPYLVGSAAMLLGYLGPQVPLPAALAEFLPAAVAPYAVLTGSALVLAIYSAYYISFDPFAGLGWATFVAVPAWLVGEAARQHVTYAAAWAFALHVLGWCVQLAGHTVEGSSLAMHDTNNTTGRRPIMVRRADGCCASGKRRGPPPAGTLRAARRTCTARCSKPDSPFLARRASPRAAPCRGLSSLLRPSTRGSSLCSCWATARRCTRACWQISTAQRRPPKKAATGGGRGRKGARHCPGSEPGSFA